MSNRRLRAMITLACTAALYEGPANGQDDLHDVVSALQQENATMRDQLRRLEEQQQRLLDLVDDLRRGGLAPVTTAWPIPISDT